MFALASANPHQDTRYSMSITYPFTLIGDSGVERRPDAREKPAGLHAAIDAC